MRTSRSRSSTRRFSEPSTGGSMRRCIRLDLIVLALLVAVFLVCAYIAFASTQIRPPVVQQPTPAAAEMRLCPYCHGLYVGTVEKNGRFRFTDHPFIHMPVTAKDSFETCAVSYRKYLIECFAAMAQAGAGQLVDSGGDTP